MFGQYAPVCSMHIAQNQHRSIAQLGTKGSFVKGEPSQDMNEVLLSVDSPSSLIDRKRCSWGAYEMQASPL